MTHGAPQPAQAAPGNRVLVVGSFPPVGGPAATATLAAVGRAWAEGAEVVTVSLRPAAADLAAPVSGPLAGRRLGQAASAAGHPARLVLGLEPAVLGPRRWLAPVALGTLAARWRTFDHVTVLLTEPLGVPRLWLRPLWRLVDVVIVPDGQRALARTQGVPDALVQVASAKTVLPAVPGITALGPPEVLPGERLKVWSSKAGRRLLGPRVEKARHSARQWIQRP